MRRKPWAKYFSALTEEFASCCGGEIDDHYSPEASSYRFEQPGDFLYPTLTSTFAGFPVQIEISESPVGRLATGSSDLEYLRIFVESPTEYDVVIRRERLWHRLLKLARLAGEFETGNPDFDRRYFLTVTSEHRGQFLRLTSSQQLIQGLEPFESVEILPTGIRWSQEIRQKSQLQYAVVREHVRRLTDLARKITSQDRR